MRTDKLVSLFLCDSEWMGATACSCQIGGEMGFHMLSSHGSGKCYISAAGCGAWVRWVCLSLCPNCFLLQMPLLALSYWQKLHAVVFRELIWVKINHQPHPPLPLALPDSQPGCRAALLWPREGSTRSKEAGAVQSHLKMTIKLKFEGLVQSLWGHLCSDSIPWASSCLCWDLCHQHVFRVTLDILLLQSSCLCKVLPRFGQRSRDIMVRGLQWKIFNIY